MEADYEVFHDQFRGPLEGLLESSRSRDVALSKLNISELIEDFSLHLRNQTSRSVNIFSEYLLIFSELVRIKTRELVPGPKEEEETEEKLPEGSEERQFYEMVSDKLRDHAKRRSELYESTPDSLPDEITEGETNYREVTLYELIEAFRNILETSRDANTPDIEITNDFETSDQMEYIISRVEEGAPVKFRDMLSTTPSREEIIVTFLAILQLVKQDDLRLIQAISGGEIKVVHPDHLESKG